MRYVQDRPVSLGEAITQWIEHAYARTSPEALHHVNQRRATRDHQYVVDEARRIGSPIVSPDYGPLTR